MKTITDITTAIKTIENEMHNYEAAHAECVIGKVQSVTYMKLQRRREVLQNELKAIQYVAEREGITLNKKAKFMYLRTVKQEIGILDVFAEIETDNIYFVAKDVAVQMGYKDQGKAVREHCLAQVHVSANDIQLMPQLSDNQGGPKTPPLGNQALTDVEYETMFMNGKNPFNAAVRTITLIPESDLYALILRSKLPAAKQFTAWVCNDVLPSIRKTGSYVMDEKCKAFDTLIDAKGFITTNAFAKTVGYGPNILLSRLRAAKILMQNGNRRNLPYQRFINAGYFIVKDVVTSNGFVTSLAYITPKGQAYLAKKVEEMEVKIKAAEEAREAAKERARLLDVAEVPNKGLQAILDLI